MTYLLDTHTFVWWLLEPERLTRRVYALMEDDRNRLLWSLASSWELAIKTSLQKLRLPGSLEDYLPDRLVRHAVDVLPIRNEHVFEVARLPHHHRDPFDRMLVAQARVEGIPLLSSDEQLRAYDVEVVWSD